MQVPSHAHPGRELVTYQRLGAQKLIQGLLRLRKSDYADLDIITFVMLVVSQGLQHRGGHRHHLFIEIRVSITTMADIYAVIAYYLRHREDIEVYIEEREQRAQEVRQRVEEQQGDLTDLRSRLLECRRNA